MTYQEEIAQIAEQYQDEIENDIRSSLLRLERAEKEVQAAKLEVDGLRGLFILERHANNSTPAASTTLHEAMQMVLTGAPEGLGAVDLAAEIDRRRLYRMRDGRSVEPQQIHARVGNYPQFFVRDGSKIKLASRQEKPPAAQ